MRSRETLNNSLPFMMRQVLHPHFRALCPRTEISTCHSPEPVEGFSQRLPKHFFVNRLMKLKATTTCILTFSIWMLNPVAAAGIKSPGPELPNFPENTDTLKQGMAYIEVSPWAYSASASGGTSKFSTPYLVHYGATDDIELRLMGDGVAWSNEPNTSANFSPLTFGALIKGFDEIEEYFIPAMCFEVLLKTELLGNAQTNAGTQPSFSVTFQNSLPFDVSFNYTFGASRTQQLIESDQAATMNRWDYTISWAFQRSVYSDDFAVFIHGYYNTTRVPTADVVPGSVYGGDSVIGGGFVWSITDELAFYGQASAGLTANSPTVSSWSGFAFSF